MSDGEILRPLSAADKVRDFSADDVTASDAPADCCRCTVFLDSVDSEASFEFPSRPLVSVEVCSAALGKLLKSCTTIGWDPGDHVDHVDNGSD